MDSAENLNKQEDFLNALDNLPTVQTNSDISRFKKFIDLDINADDVEKVELKPIEAIVAFVDILGTSALMKSLTDKNALEIIEKITGIKNIFEAHFADLKQDFSSSNLMIISDSYVISIEKKQDAFKALLDMLASCQYDCLVKHGEILRGGVAMGAIIGGRRTDNAIIGPAFIAAHELEVKNVIFPRIVIDERIVKDKMLFAKNLPIVLDKDGLRYLDFASVKNVDMNDLHVKIQEECKKLLKASKKKDNLKIRQKWNWLNTYWEQKQRMTLNCCKNKDRNCRSRHYEN